MLAHISLLVGYVRLLVPQPVMVKLFHYTVEEPEIAS